GWDTKDMLKGVGGVMDLAAASGEDLASVSDIVTDNLTAFGMKAKDSTHFADVLAQTSSKANTDVRGLGEAFKYAAPVAGALGYTVEDTSVAIGLMSNTGMDML
ncbi:phage tail tape measure protein, partial [Streptococcus anginosus]|uniref:phage tail tape measure protein n=1 Tax=Streptococcus anginosus TaxID=1328 RepID=UPI0021F82A6D